MGFDFLVDSPQTYRESERKMGMLKRTAERLERLMLLIQEDVNKKKPDLIGYVDAFGKGFKEKKIIFRIREKGEDPTENNKWISYGFFNIVDTNEDVGEESVIGVIEIPEDFGEWYGVEDITDLTNQLTGGNLSDEEAEKMLIEPFEEVTTRMGEFCKERLTGWATMDDVNKRLKNGSLDGFRPYNDGKKDCFWSISFPQLTGVEIKNKQGEIVSGIKLQQMKK